MITQTILSKSTWIYFGLMLGCLICVAIPAEQKLNFIGEASPAQKDFIIVFFYFLILVAHYSLMRYRAGLLPYGKMFLNVRIVDWGPFGREFELPNHISHPFPHFIACPPNAVEEVAKTVEDRLRAANNQRFLNPEHEKLRITVTRHYFRVGDRCNETAEQYKAYLIDLFETDRMNFFTFIEEHAEQDWILEEYLAPGFNGSVMQ